MLPALPAIAGQVGQTCIGPGVVSPRCERNDVIEGSTKRMRKPNSRVDRTTADAALPAISLEYLVGVKPLSRHVRKPSATSLHRSRNPLPVCTTFALDRGAVLEIRSV
jgi:hypothetical protein